jgi:uncharacterized protein (TIGR00159 family)
MLDFGIKDFIDILLVAVVLFYAYRLMKKSRSVNLFYGVLLFISVWILVSKVLEMKLLGSILDQLVSVGAIALIVLFQEEIRHLFYALGTHERVNKLFQFFKPKTKLESGEFRYERDTIMPILLACLNMSKQKTGALIVLQNDLPLGDFIRTGERIDAKISQRLIENIFFKNSPLHDGAMIISGGQVTAASCILPISHDLDIPKEFGLRHRAARGISKETDALAIVVSEETGGITASFNNEYMPHMDAEMLERVLMKGRF